MQFPLAKFENKGLKRFSLSHWSQIRNSSFPHLSWELKEQSQHLFLLTKFQAIIRKSCIILRFQRHKRYWFQDKGSRKFVFQVMNRYFAFEIFMANC